MKEMMFAYYGLACNINMMNCADRHTKNLMTEKNQLFRHEPTDIIVLTTIINLFL